ncbi:MAG: hypothetical protein JWR23_1583 [Mucilaginibacter sp.]|nr:hypothetical protein [Mucilaginibacter sp.]
MYHLVVIMHIPVYWQVFVQEFKDTEVWIKIKVPERDAYYRENGRMIYNPYQSHLVYGNEMAALRKMLYEMLYRVV